jgi:ATP-binding cassette, subfamily G (WHITE), member 2, PDR
LYVSLPANLSVRSIPGGFIDFTMSSGVPWGALAQEQALLTSIETHADGKEAGPHHQKEEAGDSASDSDDNLKREEEVAELARTFTQASVKNMDGQYINPFLGSEDPLLDPNSGKFSAKAWVKTLVSIKSRDPERYPERTAGIAYR